MRSHYPVQVLYSGTQLQTAPSFYLYQQSPSKYYVPRNYGIKKFGPPAKNKITNGLEIDCAFAGDLRDYQKDVIKAWKESTTLCGGGGIVAIRPGGGKTVISIGLIADLKVKTLILVHNSDLLNQWIERLEMFLPTARLGKIKAKICNTSEKDVVIGSIQSIRQKLSLSSSSLKVIFNFIISFLLFKNGLILKTQGGLNT